MVQLVKFNVHWSGLGEEGLTGCYFTPGGVDSLGALEDAANGARDEIAAATYKAAITNMLSSDQKIDKITAYYYADAKLPATFAASAAFAGGGLAGSSAPTLPLQTSCCVTLNTGHSGASYRGRMYFPATGVAMQAGHTFADVNITPLANAIAGTSTTDGLLWDFARALDAAGTGGSDPVVFSRKLDAFNVITSVSIDNRPDVQRRRAASQQPTATVTKPYIAFTG